MKLPSLQIGDLVARIPIIQGGMGIGVSRSNLASAVANEGGIGVISGVQIGFQEPDFETNNREANIRALGKEIRRARQLSPNGIIGVNFLVAMNNYREMVMAAVEEKIDLIISGAGLPKSLPEFVEGTKTKIAPIVSSGKAAMLISKLWDKRYNHIPDAVIVEGPDAGGHLGFSEEELQSNPRPSSKRSGKVSTNRLAVSKAFWFWSLTSNRSNVLFINLLPRLLFAIIRSTVS
jgi:NAD(P)H-dependent flavin oxidoreductase YrpB (nitropropane dioxygenase family)